MSIADKLTTIADNQQKVYDTGYEKGNQTGYDAGKETQEQDFWDTYQQNGARTNYTGAFAGRGWKDEIFKPKYSIKPTTAKHMFYASSVEKLNEIMEERGLFLDFNDCTDFENAFASSSIKKLKVIDIRKAKSTYTAFAYTGILITIEKLIVSENTKFSYSFLNCINLTNLTIEGTIGQNGFDVSSSKKLSKDSIISIINALSDTTTALTVTLSKTAVNNAFETAKGNADGSTSEEWAALIATKQNWTISLV